MFNKSTIEGSDSSMMKSIKTSTNNLKVANSKSTATAKRASPQNLRISIREQSTQVTITCKQPRYKDQFYFGTAETKFKIHLIAEASKDIGLSKKFQLFKKINSLRRVTWKVDKNVFYVNL